MLETLPLFSHKALFSFIDHYLPNNPIIVEAGAFTGGDTRRFAKHWEHGSIHAFEPIPELYTMLVEKNRAYNNIYCYKLALSNTNQPQTIHIAKKTSHPDRVTQASSLNTPCTDNVHNSITFPEQMSVPCTRLDTWAQTHKVNHIDLLWLDLQGHEIYALYGAGILKNNITLVHMEVALKKRYHGQPLVDDVITTMAHEGFTPLAKDFTDTNAHPFGNIIFINTDKR